MERSPGNSSIERELGSDWGVAGGGGSTSGKKEFTFKCLFVFVRLPSLSLSLLQCFTVGRSLGLFVKAAANRKKKGRTLKDETHHREEERAKRMSLLPSPIAQLASAG